MAKPLGFFNIKLDKINSTEFNVLAKTGDYSGALEVITTQTLFSAPPDYSQHRDHYWKLAWTNLITQLDANGLRALYYRLTVGNYDQLQNTLQTCCNDSIDIDSIDIEFIKCMSGDRKLPKEKLCLSSWEEAHISWLKANPKPDEESYQISQEDYNDICDNPVNAGVAFCWERNDDQVNPHTAPSKNDKLDYSDWNPPYDPNPIAEARAEIIFLDAKWFDEPANIQRNLRVRNVINPQVEIDAGGGHSILIIVGRDGSRRMIRLPTHFNGGVSDSTLDKVYRNDASIATLT